MTQNKRRWMIGVILAIAIATIVFALASCKKITDYRTEKKEYGTMSSADSIIYRRYPMLIKHDETSKNDNKKPKNN